MNVETWQVHVLSRCLKCRLPHWLEFDGDQPVATCRECGKVEEL